MKPIPIIVLVTYILLFVIAGLIFGAAPVLYTLAVMFALATVFFILILIEEHPWSYAYFWDNLLGYAMMAYGAVFFFVPILVLNIFSDMRDEGKISTKWM